MATCKAIVQEGPRKGNQCTFILPEDSTDTYCGRHQRNKKYDEGITEGKRWCRFFFRGCDTEITEQPQKVLACQSCLKKKKTNPTCQHNECAFQAVKGEVFCGKHHRDKYRLEEAEKGIKYCDIDRGCFTPVEEGKSSCTKCLEKERTTSTSRRNERIKQNTMLSIYDTTNKRICVKCNKEFDFFKTTKGTESQKCRSCFETQLKVELSREPRKRNYKAEMFANMKSQYTMYFKSSLKRNKEFLINFEDFCEIITKPCHYCNDIIEGETNGIDRLNNDIDYTLENCVPCCEICNRMKHFYHPTFFVEKARIICGQTKATTDFFKKWKTYYSRSCNHNYKAYKKEAEERNLPFNLTEQQYNTLIYSACYMCGYSQRQGIGIDRFDNNTRTYDIDNCRPCCGSCNLSKADFKYSDVLIKSAKITEKWKDTSVFDSIPVPSNPFKKTESKETQKRWQATTINKAIRSNNQHEYYLNITPAATEDEVNKLAEHVLTLNEEESLAYIKKFIAKINMRRKREGKT